MTLKNKFLSAAFMGYGEFFGLSISLFAKFSFPPHVDGTKPITYKCIHLAGQGLNSIIRQIFEKDL